MHSNRIGLLVCLPLSPPQSSPLILLILKWLLNLFTHIIACQSFWLYYSSRALNGNRTSYTDNEGNFSVLLGKSRCRIPSNVMLYVYVNVGLCISFKLVLNYRFTRKHAVTCQMTKLKLFLNEFDVRGKTIHGLEEDSASQVVEHSS